MLTRYAFDVCMHDCKCASLFFFWTVAAQTPVPCDCLCIVLEHLPHSLAIHLFPELVDSLSPSPLFSFPWLYSSSATATAARCSCCYSCYFLAPCFRPWSGDQRRGNERLDAKRESIKVAVAVVGDADDRLDKLSKENLSGRVTTGP